MTESKTISDIEAVAVYQQKGLDPNVIETIDADRPFVFLPASMNPISVEAYLERPARMRKDITFVDVEGFVRHVGEFGVSSNPHLFAVTRESSTDAGLEIRCVFDFDGAPENVLAGPRPSWNTNIATLKLGYHPDYAMLLAMSGNLVDQRDFAEWAEENLHLFYKPDAATILELAQELKGSITAKFERGQRLSNGQIAFVHKETIEGRTANGRVQVPERITIKCPMFEGQEPRKIELAFRYRPNESGLKMGLKLLSKEEERAAIKSVKDQVSTETGFAIANVASFIGIAVTPSHPR